MVLKPELVIIKDFVSFNTPILNEMHKQSPELSTAVWNVMTAITNKFVPTTKKPQPVKPASNEPSSNVIPSVEKTIKQKAQELVGYTLVNPKGIRYEVSSVKVNPKNLLADLMRVTNGEVSQLNIPKTLLDDLLAEKIVGGLMPIKPEPNTTVVNEPEPVASQIATHISIPEPTTVPIEEVSIPDNEDFNTWTQPQLKAKAQEIKETLKYLDEDDVEFQELKIQLETIQLIIED